LVELLAESKTVLVEVEVQASGDVKEATRECRALELSELLGKGPRELFTVRFTRGNRPSKVEWRPWADPCPD
jgi:hypothetical protein